MEKLEEPRIKQEMHSGKSKRCLACPKQLDPQPLILKGLSFARCGSCGLLWREPMPSVQENLEFYTKDYYQELASRTPSIHEARQVLYAEALQECAGYRKQGRILDIGSGHGHFLKAAQEEKWEVWGIEPSKEACEQARPWMGARLVNQSLEDADFVPGYFDVITLWNVIDCFPDPDLVIKKICRWLAPGGLLLARTPNASFHLFLYRLYSAFRPFLEKWGLKREPFVFHNVNYSCEAMRRLLAGRGFSSLRVSNSQLTQGDPYQVLSLRGLMRIVKTLIFQTARALDFLSAGRILVGPSFLLRAVKDDSMQSKNPGKELRVILKRAVLYGLAIFGYGMLLPFWFKVLGKNRNIRILLYHSVQSGNGGDMSVNHAMFEKQLDFIRKHYDPISLKDAVSFLRKNELPPRSSVAITFDDGYFDNYQVALPVLLRKGLNAAFFLLTAGEGDDRRATHLEDDALEGNRLLHWSEVREMAASGMEFGSHGKSHFRLRELSVDALESEMADSKQRIERETGRSAEYFSFPYGTCLDFDARTKFYVEQAGYQAAFSKIFGTNGIGTDLYAIKRIGVEASDTLFTLRAKLNGALDLLVLFDLPWIRKTVRWFNHWVLSGRRDTGKQDPILLVSVDFPPHTDGVSTISRELSTRIANAGHPVTVIGPRDKGAREFDAAERYRAFRVPGYEWGYFRFVPIFFCMPWVVLRYGVRKVFAMNIAYGGVICWLLSWIKPLEYVLFAYGYEFEKVKNNPVARWLYLQIYSRAKEIVCCSRLVKDRLAEFGVRDKKIEVLYPAVDLTRYRPCPVPQDFLARNQLAGRRILLTVGRLVQRKGHDQVFRALPEIIQKFPDVLYCVVGIGEDESLLRAEVARLRLENYVRFMGKINEEDLVRLYNACEIFLMPSREIAEGGHMEGFGIVYLEANACKKPVLGGNSGGVKEAVQDGITGWLVNPESPSEIRDIVIYLMSHPEEGRRVGEQGFEWVQRNFSWDHYVRESYRLLTAKELA